MGDRQTFQVMPTAATGTPDADRKARALPFRHANETAKPYHYGVTLRERHRAPRSRPTDHAAIMRFTFPGDSSSLIFDNVNGKLGAHHRPRQGRRDRLVGRPQRPLQRRDADVHLRHVRQADQGEREAARRQPAVDRATRASTPATREHADRDVADRHRRRRKHNLELELAAGDTRRERPATARSSSGTTSSAPSRSRAPPTTSARRSTRTSTGCSCIRTRRTRTPARRPARSGSTRCSRRTDTPPSSADEDRRARRRRQGLRQQRLLGHLPDHLVGVLAVHAERRPASWSTASSSSTATAAGSRAGRRRATRT